MRRTLRLWLLAAASALAMAGPARAQTEEELHDDLALSALPGPGGRGAGPALFPIEKVLDSLRSALGFSFIFDSRLIAGAKIGAVDLSKSPERALRNELKSLDLDLHQVAARTFAITHAAPAGESAEEIVAEVETVPEPLIDTILVIGSAPIANATTGSKRLFDIDTDDLAYLSVTSPAEAIYDLPQSLASFTPSNTALFGATAGISLADLRGLGPKRTMVLVNGRRRTITTGGNSEVGGVDLNSIAEPFLERIEVQGLPGGARHGAGAVAGVINFVSKSDVVGLEAGARTGISERGDSEEISLHALGGADIGEFGNITIGLNVTRMEGLVGADRPFSAIPYGFGRNGFKTSYRAGQFLPGYGQSAVTDRGSFGGVILSDGSFESFPDGRSYIPGADGSVAPFVGALSQLYNWASWQNIVIPNDRLIGRLALTGDIADGWRVLAEVDAGVSASDNNLAPLPATRARGVDPVTGDAAVIPLSNPFLPQSVRDLVTGSFGAAATGVVFDHRYAELGPRRHQIDRRYVDIAAGVETGEAASGRLGLTYRFAQNRVVTRDADRIDNNKLKIALDPALCGATQGCSVVDYFTTAQISESALAYIKIPEIRRTMSVEEHEIAAAAAKSFSIDDELTAKASAGIEWRRSSLSDHDEIPAGVAPVGYLGGANYAGAVNSIEAYAEIDAPLRRAPKAGGDIDASLALRMTKSSLFDYSMNFEAGLDWRPVDGVSLFMRRHIGERTPDLIELFSIGPTLETGFLDPCGLAPSLQTPEIQQNCASSGPLGVRQGFVQTSPLASATFYGNAELEAEEVRSAAYGATISPTDFFPSVPGRMEITATWLDFKISKAIQEASDVLDSCYSSIGLSAPSCGVNPRTGAPIIMRDPSTRQVVSYDSVLQNAGAMTWRGLDLELRYTAEPEFLPFADRIWVSALHTYTERVKNTYSDGRTERMDGLIDFPRHRTLISAGLDAGRLSFVAYGNRRGRALTQEIDIPETRIPAAFYLDTTVRFDVTDHAYIQASVKNITDKEPAITAFNDIGNFAPEYYDPVGRRYALTVRLSF